MRTHARKSKLCEADGRKTKAGRTFCGLPRLRYSVARCAPYKSSHPDHAKAQRKLCFLFVWGELAMWCNVVFPGLNPSEENKAECKAADCKANENGARGGTPFCFGYIKECVPLCAFRAGG